MSKILKVLIVLVTILAVAAPVVIAEDRLSLSGAMRVRAFTFNEFDFDDSVDTSTAFMDQRFRLGGKLSVAEGVSITFRTDITETKWGANGTTTGKFGSGRPGSTQQWDRAHIDFTKGMLSVRAGQQWVGMGTNVAFDNQGTGTKWHFKTGAPITLIYQRTDDLGSAQSDDSDLYGAQIDHKTDNYSANVFFGYAHKPAGNLDANVYLVGTSGKFNLGPVFLTAELDFFGGDAIDSANVPVGSDFGPGDVDAVGVQGYLDASMPINESWTLGGMFLYAASADRAGDNEVQITRLGNAFNGWSPETYGPFTTDFAESGIDGYIFDPADNDLGVVSLMVYTNYKLNDDTSLTGQVAYIAPEDDSVNGNDDPTSATYTNFDSVIMSNLGITYQLLANTTLASQLNYTAKSVVNGSDPDGAYALMGRLQVNF